MHPELFTLPIFGVTIKTYGFCLMIGFLSAVSSEMPLDIPWPSVMRARIFAMIDMSSRNSIAFRLRSSCRREATHNLLKIGLRCRSVNRARRCPA